MKVSHVHCRVRDLAAAARCSNRCGRSSDRIWRLRDFADLAATANEQCRIVTDLEQCFNNAHVELHEEHCFGK